MDLIKLKTAYDKFHVAPYDMQLSEIDEVRFSKQVFRAYGVFQDLDSDCRFVVNNYGEMLYIITSDLEFFDFDLKFLGCLKITRPSTPVEVNFSINGKRFSTSNSSDEWQFVDSSMNTVQLGICCEQWNWRRLLEAEVKVVEMFLEKHHA